MAVKKGVKKKEHENLTPENIERVIGLLAATPPISKKEACEILNISYNTTRLGKIIDEHEQNKAEDARRRAANRGKSFDDFEKQAIIEAVLDGESVTEIGKRLYRSNASVNRTIEVIGIPEKSESYFKPALIPEQCVSDTFEVGQIVWTAKRNAIAVICPSLFPSSGEENVYQVYEFERIEKLSDKEGREQKFFRNCNVGDYAGRYANYRASEIASLEHLKQYGIDLHKTYAPHFPLAVRKAIGMET